jgi:predicted nuclease of predicted toxin-antitoxin system
MKLLLDMNLSPRWCDILRRHGLSCTHWREVGDLHATDATVMQWADEHGCVVVTHDLDFGALLAATQALAPSVIQIRTQDIMPSVMEGLLVGVLRRYERELEAGALIVVDTTKARVRILPLSS